MKVLPRTWKAIQSSPLEQAVTPGTRKGQQGGYDYEVDCSNHSAQKASVVLAPVGLRDREEADQECNLHSSPLRV